MLFPWSTGESATVTLLCSCSKCEQGEVNPGFTRAHHLKLQNHFDSPFSDVGATILETVEKRIFPLFQLVKIPSPFVFCFSVQTPSV